MLLMISPAKTLDFSPSAVSEFTLPGQTEQTLKLVRKMRRFSGKSLQKLMGVSPKIADLNKARFAEFETPTELDANSKQAILAFKGDTYRDMALEDWTAADYAFAQDHLRILSGLYGVLRPLDLIRPYRLEMGTSLKIGRGSNLYAFWGSQLADRVAEQMSSVGSDAVIKLASNEYFKSIEKHLPTSARVIEVDFLDMKNGKYKMISFFAKQSRGAMASWAVRNRLTTSEQLVDFTQGGYAYHAESSGPLRLVFRRDNETAAAA